MSDAVLIDNFKGAYKATTHLIEQGHRRIGCILGLANSQLTFERLAGYRQALEDHSLPFDETLLRTGDYTSPTGLMRGRELLELPEPPSAIFACNDMMALGAMQAINERGLRVPDQIAVIGFDGIALTEHMYPALSTVEQPIMEMSQLAIGMLIDRIHNRAPNESRTIIVEPHLVCRASTLGFLVSTQEHSFSSSTEASLV
jgi:LacI family transcriptional regulator